MEVGGEIEDVVSENERNEEVKQRHLYIITLLNIEFGQSAANWHKKTK